MFQSRIWDPQARPRRENCLRAAAAANAAWKELPEEHFPAWFFGLGFCASIRGQLLVLWILGMGLEGRMAVGVRCISWFKSRARAPETGEGVILKSYAKRS